MAGRRGSVNSVYNEDEDELREQYEQYNKETGGGQELYEAVQAAMHGRTTKIKTEAFNKIIILIKSGADVNTINFFDQDTPLHSASEEGNTKIVEILLEAGAIVDPSDIEVAPKKIKHMLLLSRTVSKKARNQALRNIFEARAGIASEPGTGPANTIRAFAGISAPRGAEGAFGSNTSWVREVGPRGKTRKNAPKGGKRTYRLKRRL